MKLTTRILTALFGLTLLSACSDESDGNGFVGYIEAEFVYVNAPQSGWIEALPATEGDRVLPGQVLVALDTDQQNAILAEAKAKLAQAQANSQDLATGARREEILELEAALSEAQAQLALAESDRKRWLPLVDKGTAPKSRRDEVEANFDAAEARVLRVEKQIQVAHLAGRDATRDAAAAAVTSAQAVVDQAEWQLSERQIIARNTGRVEEVFHRQGEFVPQGSPILALIPDDALKVRFFVPQDRLPQLQIGMAVDVAPDGVAQPIAAKVSYIANEAEFTPPVIYSKDSRDKLVFLVEAKLAVGAGLHPGLPVDVLLP
jgi:HlyD family secretion protein